MIEKKENKKEKRGVKVRVVMERIREKMSWKSLIKGLMCGTPKEDGVDEHRVFADVDPKGLRAPSPNSLDSGEICTCFCERGSTT